MNYRATALLTASLLTLAAFAANSPAERVATTPRNSDAIFTTDGLLKPPVDYREWIFLASGLDMNYSDGPGMDHSMFDNVFVDPTAYRAFMQTGTWPDGTRLIKENRVAGEKGSINKHGKFQTADTMGIEVHVKDSKRFPGNWAFFMFASTRSEPATQIPASASCYSCHQQHGAVDTTFVQFYPTLLGVATEKRTLVPGK